MSSTKIEPLLKKYRAFAQIPSLVGAKINAEKNVISSVWSQRNLENGKISTFLKSHVVDIGKKKCIDLLPLDISKESLSAVSPNENYRAVLRDVESKENSSQFLEIWQNDNLLRSLDLTNLELHGKVYTDGEFSSFEWSPDESKLMFVVEKKVPKKSPINKRKKTKTEGEVEGTSTVWQPLEYEQDWGEQLVGKISSIIAIYDIQNDEVTLPEGLPENICVARPVWSPNTNYIVGIAYKIEPRKLGLIYCSNRKSTLFKLDFSGKYSEIPLDNKSVKAPKFSPDGNLIWLERDAEGPHHGCMALMKATMPFSENMTITTVIDIVQMELKISNDKIFYGLYNTTFPQRCWTNNGNLILSTNQKNSIITYIIDLESKTLTELEYANGSQIILDVFDDYILVSRRNFFYQDTLFLGVITNRNKTDAIDWIQINKTKRTEGLNKDLIFQNIDLKQPSEDTIRDFNAIYVGPNTAVNGEVPLIVWPHGGPHSAFANNLSLELTFLLSLGYGVLQVNYRGSVGSGDSSVKFLLGRIGESDVSDCILATDTTIDRFPCLDKNRIALVGGSHGGFLVTNLSGQYPDKFRAVVARNPVIDVSSMSVVSDIPDWCFVECGFDYTQKGEVSWDNLINMRKCSPIRYAHKVKAPTLLQIGTKDLRVPPSQGIEYYHRLKANNIQVSMNIYDDNHPLSLVPNEMENILSTALWLDENMKKL